MTIAAAGVGGLPPTVRVGPPINPERMKYERMWTLPEYRAIAPGEQWAITFMQQAHIEKDADVIDFGCGTGRGALALALLGGMKVTMIDFVENCLDEDVAKACQTQGDRLKFVLADLTEPLPMSLSAAYGYCCDVMEHIPPQDVRKVLLNVLMCANHCFFAISTREDIHGAKIGEILHLTVQPMSWWMEQLRSLGAVIHWSEELDGACAIYCSAWHEASEVLKEGKVNCDVEVVEAQVIENSKKWKHVMPHKRQDREVVLLAGGPSMNDCIDEIRKLRADGAALVTCNGAYNWALDHDLSISAQIVLDARPFNARFTHPVVEHCKYLIASQVHPSTLEGLPYERTLLWHSGIADASEKIIQETIGYYFPVPGGSTVILRSFALLRLLGLWRFHVFGFDSCVRPDRHHAYPQPENDNEPLMPVTCGGQTFMCAPWMISQASEFRGLVKCLGDEVQMAIYGDGLIAEMVKTGANLSLQDQQTET